MEKYELRLKRAAAREIEALPTKKLRRQVLKRVSLLREDPRPLGCRKLSTREWYRLRQAAWRILYAVDDERCLVTVVKIAHRREVYRND